MFTIKRVLFLMIAFVLVLTFGMEIMAAETTTANIQSLKGSMVPESFRKKMSSDGLVNLEAARGHILNEDSAQDVSWDDPKADFSGQFKITGRYTLKDTSTRCREYIHVLKNKKGEPVPSDITNRPFKIRSTVCFDGSAWGKFDGDTSLLIAETAETKPAASGPIGPEHRLGHSNMVGPVALGQILDGFKLFRKNIEAQENPVVADMVRDQMYTWIKQIVNQMTEHNKTIALDQLAILLGEVKTDSVKFKTIELLRNRLDVRVGNAKTISKMFTSSTKKKQVERMLR